MFPPLFPILNTAAIKAIVGAAPMRVYDMGFAPDGVIAPYIVWFVVGGQPEDQISGAPQGDTDTVQIDCYAGPDDNDRATIRALGLAVRNALDAAGHANRLIINNRDDVTKLFRVSIEADLILTR